MFFTHEPTRGRRASTSGERLPGSLGQLEAAGVLPLRPVEPFEFVDGPSGRSCFREPCWTAAAEPNQSLTIAHGARETRASTFKRKAPITGAFL